jgi:hypothetical protein
MERHQFSPLGSSAKLFQTVAKLQGRHRQTNQRTRLTDSQVQRADFCGLLEHFVTQVTAVLVKNHVLRQVEPSGSLSFFVSAVFLLWIAAMVRVSSDSSLSWKFNRSSSMSQPFAAFGWPSATSATPSSESAAHCSVVHVFLSCTMMRLTTVRSLLYCSARVTFGAAVWSIQFLYSRATADDGEMNPRASFFAEEMGGRSLAEFKMKVISEETW